MDRHLIYPPGWDNRKKEDDWDADPSLRGKTIPIPGTAIVLDTPDALHAWISDRKRRWPTVDRVQDKKRKAEEAFLSGQLSVQDLGLFPSKRRRHNDEPRNHPIRKAHVTLAKPASSSSDDDAPQSVSSKVPPNEHHQYQPPVPKRPIRLPNKVPLNPFAPRSNLLQSLLGPEIQVTVSNLSQAIRFLVDNDLLQNVELKPGQSSEMIQVLSETSSV